MTVPQQIAAGSALYVPLPIGLPALTATQTDPAVESDEPETVNAVRKTRPADLSLTGLKWTDSVIHLLFAGVGIIIIVIGVLLVSGLAGSAAKLAVVAAAPETAPALAARG